MYTLDDYKEKWNRKNTLFETSSYDAQSLGVIFRKRIKKQTGMAMRYFWASFAYQLIVYALLSHVIVRYWQKTDFVLLGILGVAIFLPFTVMLMRKYKAMAIIKLNISSSTSIEDYISRQRDLLQQFFAFKRRYELILIPLSCAIGIILTFNIYVPGGILDNIGVAVVAYIITLLSCMAAIWSENRKNFQEPLKGLQDILDDFRA